MKNIFKKDSEPKYRHEMKYEINYLDLLILRMKLKAVMEIDSHAIKGKTEIRSLYFDNIDDSALREKIDGVNKREKWRIRYYNGDTSFIKLEKKCKNNNLCLKEFCMLTLDEAQKIANGDTSWMATADRPLVVELYYNMQTKGLRPQTIVDYTREPFVYKPGNVRVTIDYNIRTGLKCTDFLNPDAVTIPAGDNPIILEVKWDEYLADTIKTAINMNGRPVGAFSKYAQCRIYG